MDSKLSNAFPRARERVSEAKVESEIRSETRIYEKWLIRFEPESMNPRFLRFRFRSDLALDHGLGIIR